MTRSGTTLLLVVRRALSKWKWIRNAQNCKKVQNVNKNLRAQLKKKYRGVLLGKTARVIYLRKWCKIREYIIVRSFEPVDASIKSVCMKRRENSVGVWRESKRDRRATVYQTSVSSSVNLKRGSAVACSNMASSANMRYRINCTPRRLRRITPLAARK